jgi:omega-6 fatty acid desaturase (delta-12 desaturase)
MFTKAAYKKIKSKLSFKRNYAVTFAIIVLDIALMYGAASLISQGWLGYLASQIVLAIVFFHSFSIVHEAGHNNTSSNNILNYITGLYASIFCCMPFFPWVYIHQQHHYGAGSIEHDPAACKLKGWKQSGSIPAFIRFAWRSWIPLTALLQHVIFLSYPLVVFKERNFVKTFRCVLSVVVVLAGWFVLSRISPEFFQFKNFWFAILIYLFLEELVNLPHHSDLYQSTQRMAPWDQWRATRSCHYPWLLSELIVLNFNYHVEHHLYPTLPWYKLRQASKLVEPQIPGYIKCVGIEWNLKNRTRSIEDVLL